LQLHAGRVWGEMKVPSSNATLDLKSL
jgi:hypothetical protein